LKSTIDHWRLLLVIAVAANCGGRSGLYTAGDGGSTSMIGVTGSGGVISSGGNGGAKKDGGLSDSQSPTSDASCDTARLWDAVSLASGMGRCWPGETGWGTVVIDSDGRVIDNSIFLDDADLRRAWLESLADDRWPCLAGQTLRYWCYSD
jgi:hypothetical protein